MQCIRICFGCTHRNSRKHSTILLMTGFILLILIILNLYSRKYSKYYENNDEIGNYYDYKPGSFLKGIKPNENSTNHCKFNYGLPDKFIWDAVKVDHTPELGVHSKYNVIYNVIEGKFKNNIGNAVTYSTHATPEFIYHIVEIAKYWDGPISMAVFVPDYDFDIAIQIMKELCLCYDEMYKVSMHVFYPNDLMPVFNEKNIEDSAEIVNNDDNKLKYKNMSDTLRAAYVNESIRKKIDAMTSKMNRNGRKGVQVTFEDCSSPVYSFITYRKHYNLMYPVNIGRNVARNASTTYYMLVSDIEMVPSDGLATGFLEMLKRMMGQKRRDSGNFFHKVVFVVPLFEVERGEQLPRDKTSLLKMVEANRATYFHQKICSHCQRFPGIQTWLSRFRASDVDPFVVSKREYPYHRWEPIYFGTNHDPWYNEVLSWEGRQDKMTQMLELCLLEYKLAVLEGGFLVHAAALQPRKHPHFENINNKHYKDIVRKLKKTYTDIPQCKVK